MPLPAGWLGVNVRVRPTSNCSEGEPAGPGSGTDYRVVRVVTDCAINRDTTRARYITPENSSIMTRARDIGRRGTMSPSPTPDSVVKLRKSSSIHVRGLPEAARAPKLPGSKAWHTT